MALDKKCLQWIWIRSSMIHECMQGCNCNLVFYCCFVKIKGCNLEYLVVKDENQDARSDIY